MSNDFIDLSNSGIIPGFEIKLPKTNVKNYLINNEIVKSISKPDTFQIGIIAVVGKNNTQLIILIKTAEGLEDIKKMFLENSVEWLLIKR